MTMEACRFEDFVGDADVFFAKHFGRTAYLCQGALAHRLADLPTVRDLDDLLVLEAAPPSCLRVTKDGRAVPDSAYTRITGRGARRTASVDPASAYALFRSGATFTWDSLNHILPSARRLLEPFSQAFACTAEILLFMTPAGNDGFPPHCDPIEVFVVQVSGTKAWNVWDTPSSRSGAEMVYRAADLGEPALAVTLSPGDVLYLPHGTPHTATARDTLSVHLSVGVEPRRWRDLLRETVTALLAADGFGDFPPLAAADPGVMATELSRMLELLRYEMAKLESAAEVSRLVEAGRRRAGAGRCRGFEAASQARAIQP